MYTRKSKLNLIATTAIAALIISFFSVKRGVAEDKYALFLKKKTILCIARHIGDYKNAAKSTGFVAFAPRNCPAFIDGGLEFRNDSPDISLDDDSGVKEPEVTILGYSTLNCFSSITHLIEDAEDDNLFEIDTENCDVRAAP